MAAESGLLGLCMGICNTGIQGIVMTTGLGLSRGPRNVRLIKFGMEFARLKLG